MLNSNETFSIEEYFQLGNTETQLDYLREPDSGSYGKRKSKEEFVSWLRNRTKRASIDIIDLMEHTASSPGLNVVRYQIIKSATSTSANYRAACRARSKKEFFAKICIVVEECDETQHWLEILLESTIKIDKNKVASFHREWTELVKIMTSAKTNAYQSK